ncbi:MAG: hypothetical protein JJ897_16020 [Marinibacterium sp.]|nr:hypothetical protein [Marinibacterium sp.]
MRRVDNAQEKTQKTGLINRRRGGLLAPPYVELNGDLAQISGQVAVICRVDWAAEMAHPVDSTGPYMAA